MMAYTSLFPNSSMPSINTAPFLFFKIRSKSWAVFTGVLSICVIIKPCLTPLFLSTPVLTEVTSTPPAILNLSLVSLSTV